MAARAKPLADPLSARPFAARLDGCPHAVLELHRSVLCAFAAGAVPDMRFLRARARELDVELEPALAALQRRDVLRVDPETSGIRVAYPFSGAPTSHEVSRGGIHAFAMCAIDALGIAFMLGEPVMVRSRDPVDQRAIEACIDPTGAHTWTPPATMVVAATSGAGPSAISRCPYIRFVADLDAAHELLARLDAVAGAVVAMPEAIELGRLRFGSLLDLA